MVTFEKTAGRLSLDSQHGTAIIMAMLILLVLSVIGVYAVSTSTVETKITGVEQGFQEAFYTADAGEPVGTYVTKEILHFDPQSLSDFADSLASVAPSFPTSIVQSNLITSNKLFINPSSSNPRVLTEPQPGSADIIAALTNSQALGLPQYVQLLINISRLSVKAMPGGGIEFASGYEGIGLGGGGSEAVIYSVDSVGLYGLRGAESRVSVGYLYVPGVAGDE